MIICENLATLSNAMIWDNPKKLITRKKKKNCWSHLSYQCRFYFGVLVLYEYTLTTMTNNRGVFRMTIKIKFLKIIEVKIHFLKQEFISSSSYNIQDRKSVHLLLYTIFLFSHLKKQEKIENFQIGIPTEKQTQKRECFFKFTTNIWTT